MGVGDSISLDSGVDLRGDSEQIDVATYVASTIFNAAAFPAGMPEYLRRHIEAQATLAQRLDTAGFTIGGANGGPIGEKSKDERQKEADDRALEDLSFVINRAEQEQKRQQENERQWLASSHTYAGQTMSGEDWRKMAEWFRDDAHMEDWEDAMMAETGQSRAEVRRTGGKLNRFYDLLDKDARGTLTGTERSELDGLQNDRDVRTGVSVQRKIQDFRVDPRNEKTIASSDTLDGTRSDILASRASLNDDVTASGGRLSTVPPLTPSYADAAAGNAKPEPPKPVAPAAAPVAANTITVNPDNMFG